MRTVTGRAQSQWSPRPSLTFLLRRWELSSPTFLKRQESTPPRAGAAPGEGIAQLTQCIPSGSGEQGDVSPGSFPSCRKPCRSAPAGPQRPLAASPVQCLSGTALKRRPSYPVDSPSFDLPVVGCWGLGLAVAARTAETLEVVGESLRGLRKVTGVSEGLGPVVERAEASVRTVAGREGCLEAAWAPEAEDEGSGVTGGGPGAPREAGGRVEVPGKIDGPGEVRGGREAPGSPESVALGPKGGEGEAWAPEGLMGKVCM